MSGFDAELALDALLDPARLATAWQVAHDRAVAKATDDAPSVRGEHVVDTPPVVASTSSVLSEVAPTAVSVAAPTAVSVAAPAALAGVPPVAAPAALPVAIAHRRVLDELDRLLAAGLPATARVVLTAPLAQLAAVLDPPGPLDAVAAEAALDALEDVFQAVLSAARWPAGGEPEED